MLNLGAETYKEVPATAAAKKVSPPRSFGQKIDHNDDKARKKESAFSKVEKTTRSKSKSSSPIEEVAYIFTGRRSPQPYGQGASSTENLAPVDFATTKKVEAEDEGEYYTHAQEKIIEREIKELTAEFERRTKKTSFEEFNRRLGDDARTRIPLVPGVDLSSPAWSRCCLR